MKKIIYSVLTILLVVILTACGSGKKTLKCTYSSEQTNYKINTEYTINAKKKIVQTVDIKQVIESDNQETLDKFEKELNEQYENDNNLYNGYTYEVKKEENKVVATITIDYTKMDLNKFIRNNGAMKKYVNDDNEYTIDGAEKLYTSTGATCE